MLSRFIRFENLCRFYKFFKQLFSRHFVQTSFSKTTFQQTKIRLKTSIQDQFGHIRIFHVTFMSFNLCSLGNNNVSLNQFVCLKQNTKTLQSELYKVKFIIFLILCPENVCRKCLLKVCFENRLQKMSPEKLKNLQTKIFCPDFSDFSADEILSRKHCTD